MIPILNNYEMCSKIAKISKFYIKLFYIFNVCTKCDRNIKFITRIRGVPENIKYHVPYSENFQSEGYILAMPSFWLMDLKLEHIKIALYQIVTLLNFLQTIVKRP